MKLRNYSKRSVLGDYQSTISAPEPFQNANQLLMGGTMRQQFTKKHARETPEYGICVGTEDLGGCQNYGPFLGALNIRYRIVIGTQKGTIMLTATHLVVGARNFGLRPQIEDGRIGAYGRRSRALGLKM